jgi:hypothetical protein
MSHTYGGELGGTELTEHLDEDNFDTGPNNAFIR